MTNRSTKAEFGQADPSRDESRKMAALACCDKAMRAFPHPRSPEAVRALAARWGSVAGFEAAEAFEAVRLLRPGTAR